MSGALIPPAAWPRFPWKDSGWWFGVAAMVATLAFFIAPGMLELEPRRKLMVSLIPLASPLPLLVLRHAMAVGWVLGQRVRHYPRLYRMLEHEIDKTDTLSEHLGGSIENWSQYEIRSIHWFETREELCLLIRKKGGTQPEVGATFWVRDTETGRPMAISEMIELRRDGYYARIIGELDAVWLGELRSSFQREMQPPPFMAAFLSPRRRGS